MSGRYGKVRTCALHGVTGAMLEAEVAILPGLPSFDIVGLGDSAVKESRNRIRAAIRSSGYDFPPSRIIASLAPAWVRKEGSGFDLPIAVALLAACGMVKRPDPDLCMFGELSLTGEVRPVPGGIGRALAAREHEIRNLVLPWGNREECAFVEGLGRVPVRQLSDVVAYLNGGYQMPAEEPPPAAEAHPAICDLSGIVGQDFAKRALTVAAAGWHSMLMLGSPGSGKSTLSSAMPGILPELNDEEVLEVARIHSAAGLQKE
ncbi:MAG TPA: magnesium chelatase domain-containing protein, partial [Clostridia bacterium]